MCGAVLPCTVGHTERSPRVHPEGGPVVQEKPQSAEQEMRSHKSSEQRMDPGTAQDRLVMWAVRSPFRYLQQLWGVRNG